jgi:uncharacterized protein YnzC (UPF0291/DUF896 family)
MNFASGYLEGLTTFDILKEESPDTTQEYIARSLGSVLGFIGWLPTPAGVTRIGLAGLGHTMKLLGNASKGVSYLEKAKSIVTLGDKMYSSVPKLVGSIGAKGIERFFETTAAKEAMLFTEKIAGHTFAPATKEITRSLISQATFMGFASAAGARPLSLNPLEYFSAEDFQTRSQAFIQGIPFGLAQGGIASLVTKETMGRMGFKGFEELVKNSPEKAEYILKSIRAVSTGLTMSGYTSLTQDVPMEYTVYEGLLNGVFGWREMPYTMKEAHRLVNKHLPDQNVIHGDLILKSKGDIVKFMNGKGEFPSEGVQKELELLYQHHWGKDFAESMIPEMVTPEVARTLGVSMETLEKMPKSDLAAALDQPEFKQFKILRAEIAEQEYNDELSKRIKDFTDTQGRGPTEEEMVQMSEGVYPEVIKTVGEMSPKLFEEVHRIASRVSEAVEGNISYPEKHQAMLKSLEETGVSKQGMRNLLEVLKGDEPRIVTTVDNIFYENKKAGLKEYIPIKDKIQKELGLVLSDEQNKRMNLLWNMYVHSKVSEERRYDIDGNRLIAGRKYNKAGIADMDVRDFYNYETEFDTNVITIKEAEGSIGKRKSRKVIGIHEPWKYYEQGEAKFGQINNNKLLGAIFENGLLPISNRKDNQQILTEKRGSVSFDSETNAYTFNHEGTTYRVNVREGFNHIDQAENKTIGESYDSYVKDRIKYVEDNIGKTYQQAMEDPIAVQYYEKAYDEMTANRMLHWMALNRKENLYEVFASTGTLVRGAFPYTTRMQLVAGSGITLDPSVVGKESVKAIHVFMGDTGVHNAFGESERTQEDGAIVSIGMKQHYMNALGTTDDIAFYKPAIAVSLSTGLHIEKAGDHQATTLNEQKLTKALGDVNYVVNNTTAKNPGDIPMVKLSVVNGEYIVKDMLGNILSPEQIEKMKFDLPVNSIRLNPSVTEDSEMSQLHYIKQMFGNVPELQNYIDENIIKPSLEGIKEVNDKFDILKTGEDINLDDVGAQRILDAMHGKDFYKAGPKTIAVVKRLLNYVFDKGDIIEGDGEGELSSYLERLRTSVELAVNATGIDNITAAFLRERNVRDYLEQAMYKYITDRAHRPVHKGFGSSSRIFYGLSPVDAEAFRIKHGREFQQGDLLLGEAERNQKRLIPEELKGLFPDKKTITLGEVWDMYQRGDIEKKEGNLEGQVLSPEQILNKLVSDEETRINYFQDKKEQKKLLNILRTTKDRDKLIEKVGNFFWQNYYDSQEGRTQDEISRGEGSHYEILVAKTTTDEVLRYLGLKETPKSLGEKRGMPAEQYLALQDFFSRTIGTRSPQSDASGSRRLTFRGFYGPGHGATIHPLDMKYLDGADLDGDAVKLYFGMGKEFVDHIDQPHIKHRFSRFFSSPEERDSFFSRVNIHAGKTVKDFSPEDLKLVLSTGKDSKGVKYLEEFAMEKGHNKYLIGKFGEEYKSGRYADNNYEVSSQGDKRFSALFAKLSNGKTIEQTYQELKGSGKGQPSIHKDFDYWNTYKNLWKQWSNENPELINELAEKAKGKTLTDKFANTENNQARALAEILNEKFPSQFTNLKRTYSMFSPTLIMEAGRQATVGKNNLGWGLASGNRGRVLGHYLRAGGRVEVGKGDYYLIAKSDKEEFNRTIWDIVNSCADATKGKNPPVDPETMRIVGGVLSVADVLDSKGKPANVLGFINHIKSKGLGEVPILKELTEVDNNLRLRDFEGNKKHLQDIFYNLNMAVNKAKSVMPGSDFGSVWYKSAERLTKLRYEPEPLDFTNIIQSDIVRRQFDRLAKSDAPISKFAIRALGRAGVNFNNSYIAQTPIWRDIVQQYKGSDVELLNDFINPPGKGSTYLNSKAWEIAAKMPNPVRGKDPINRQSELQAQLIETSVKKLKEDAKLYPDKRSVTYELKDGRTKVEIFDTEEDAKAWLEENSWSDGKIGRVERSKGEQTKYIQELWANDYTDMNSLAFTIDYLSKYVDTKLPKENLTDENVTKLLEDKIRPFARTVSKLKNYVLNTQQGIVNTKSERTDPETGKVLFKTPQERQESFKYWEEALEKTVKYRESLDAPERQLFDALWLSSLDFNEKVDINNQAKVKAASEGDSSQENIDKIANEMIVEEANTKFDTRRGYTALVSGIANPEMIKAYYQKYAKLAGTMTQDNVSMEVLADAMNISELNGNLPHFITHNPEFASINMRPTLDKEAREYMAPFKQWFLEKHGKDQLGNIKDPIARTEFNDLRTRARKLLKDVPEQLYDFALNFPDIMSKKYGMAFSWTADLMTKQDFKLYLDYLEGRKFNPNETPKVGKSWFLQKFSRVAQSAERLQKEIDKFKLQVLRPVITGEGPVSRFLTQNVLGHYAMLYEAQKAYATAQNAVQQISVDTYKKNLPLNDTFNKQHDGIADKIVRIVAARDIEKPFAKSIITKDENGNDVITKNEFLINYEKAVKDYDALPNTKYRITAPDGSTISMNKQEMAAYIHKGILAYNQENISRWSNRPGDKLLVYGDKEYGKNRVRLVDVQKTNMKRVEESMKITGGQEDMSVMAMTELAAAMKLENNLFDVYTTPQGIFFDSQMGPEQREIFDKNVKQNIRGYSVDFKKKFSDMSATEQDAVMDQLYPNGKIAGFNLNEKLDVFSDSYWHHMTLNRKVVTEYLKKKYEPLLKTLPPEEAKKVSLRLLQEVGRTTNQEDNLNHGQEFMGQLFDKGDPIRSLHIHPNKILGERDMDDPIPQWDLSINAVITAHEVLLKMQHDMSFALSANYLVNDARKRMVFGEGTKHLANWMERYARQVMGFQDTTPPELEQGYNYGLPTNWMKFHNNAYWSKKITEIGDSWFGRKIFPEYNQLTAIAENINFVKEKKKRSEMTQSERDWNDKENARLRKQWIEQSKKNLSEQKITWLSQAEAKWSLMSLLTSFKTAITNVTTAEVMTFMNAGADAYIRSFRLKDIQDEFGSNIIKTKEDAQTILQTIGGLESFYYNDAGMDPSVRKAVHTTIGNLIHDATTKKWSDIQIVQAAKDAGVYDTILNKAAWFMKKSERVARGHSMLAHYINARRTFRHAGFELEYDDPWIMQIAREGVKSSQFLYSNGERPEFMATPMGKIFHRFQLFAYNSVEFRYNTIKAAQSTGIGPGSNDMARFQRMMACDLFMFGMASLVPFSIFGSTLPAPYNGLQNSLTYVFGTNDEKRKSFFSSLPYPANIVQPIVPPGLREIPQLFGLFVPGNGTTTQKVEDIVVGMMPFQRIGKDISRTLDNPVMLIDNMTGIPFIKIPQINRDLSNMTTFDEYLNRYRSRAYLSESKKIETDINSYLEQYPLPE